MRTVAAPAPGVRVRSPNITARLRLLAALERERERSHSVEFQGARTLVQVFATGKPVMRLELPQVVRGRLLLTYEDFITAEMEAPIQASEVLGDKSP